RAGDLAHLGPELLEVRLEPAAADRRIELVRPPPLGRLAERVPEPGADVLLGAERIEGARLGHRVLERIEVALRELGPDRLPARPPAGERVGGTRRPPGPGGRGGGAGGRAIELRPPGRSAPTVAAGQPRSGRTATMWGTKSSRR